jgi:hypothetical protein
MPVSPENQRKENIALLKQFIVVSTGLLLLILVGLAVGEQGLDNAPWDFIGDTLPPSAP